MKQNRQTAPVRTGCAGSRWLLMGTLALGGMGYGLAGPALAADKLVFSPGVVITTAVEKGDAAGNDYEFIVTVKQRDAIGFTYDWTMSAPKKWKGTRVVRQADLDSAQMLNDFYVNSAIRSLSANYTSVVWPKEAFARMKRGEAVSLKVVELTKTVPRTFQCTGNQTFSVLVDDVLRDLPAIVCRTQDNASYTILDDDSFPIGLAGRSSWGAQVVSIRTGAKGSTEKDALASHGRLTTYGIHFHTDSAELRPESEPVFREVLAFLKEQPKAGLAIEGHTDSVGSDSHNQDLSNRRADSVKRRLMEGGVATERLTTEAFGETKPVSDNATIAGRALNRRVVFVVRR